MLRTQISLPPKEYLLAKLEARRLGISLAELLRQSLRLIVPSGKQPTWMRYCGLVESGDKHSSQHIDELIYGSKN